MQYGHFNSLPLSYAVGGHGQSPLSVYWCDYPLVVQ